MFVRSADTFQTLPCAWRNFPLFEVFKRPFASTVFAAMPRIPTATLTGPIAPFRNTVLRTSLLSFDRDRWMKIFAAILPVEPHAMPAFTQTKPE